MTDAVLVTRGLTKRYGDRVAVDALDLSVRRGSITGFLGPNGAGKTTTLRMLLGLVKPTSGSALVCGVDISTDRPPVQKLGAIIETPASYQWLSAADVLAVCALTSGVKRSRVDVDRLLQRVGLGGRERDLVRTYSLGMKQRLGLACALLSDPEVLILDEPMNGLDPGGVVEMRELLAALGAEGRTLIVSSHQLAEIQQLCSDIVIVVQGKKRFAGPMTNLAGTERVRLRVVEPEQGRAVVVAAGFVVVDDDGALLVEASHTRAPELAALLVNAGVGILALEPMDFDLEAAFLDVVGAAS
ncbi:MAG: ATP-binding cassette domain-containing protein [Deltaproteobacteria bacterium]|nr:ATP-binding cassette domain-containing protein [Deltaproteobacteria bacterium]